jgi:hypothetical protein
MNELTIPSIKKYKAEIESQLKQVENFNNHQISGSGSKIAPKLDPARVSRLIAYKVAELHYVSSYLNILTNLESICKSCQLEDCSYDYEKEDEILNKIEDEMKNLSALEKKLSVQKTLYETDGASCKQNEDISDSDRRPSVMNLEQGLFDKVQRLQI